MDTPEAPNCECCGAKMYFSHIEEGFSFQPSTIFYYGCASPCFSQDFIEIFD